MLGVIGLDDLQESAYRSLVALGAAEVADLAHRLALSETDTERALRRLERHGLAAQSSARTGRWVAAPPGVALGALLTQHRHELEQAEIAAALLVEEFRAEAREPAVLDLVEVVTGANAVSQRFLQLQLGASEEVCALVTGGNPIAVSGDDNDAEAQAATRGVSYRVVLERVVLEAPGGIAGLAAALGRKEQVRVTDRVPTKLVIADRSLAMVPLTGRGAEPAALVVHESGLLESLRGLFEAVWRQALPLRLSDQGELSEVTEPGPDSIDLQILSLLLAGMTDVSVAKQLELGLRTVQRRVKRLMELTGVTTRLQLGWHAYEKGWVTRDR
ncbi:helix-turn-helix transcriptional regulator [Streptomyces sp. NBC_01387]|uniref:helix-turn-helix domain-containing protein n=1 Tax=unclassified Streptomyces TaxID=2593676 RepID=UPI0020249D9F|nr:MULTISPECIES: helix-turn-helix domain-containing protein [unclassified Streptomyces]MCX4547355.1 helix-turn-helix transcriptional regulator [Streptomyces sp. NBC_01500]WSC24510.1 helix-turn-helix transcriptional regulator [Streptomyces sp. NBC_01766]WSV58487.1 helix-turn-helix transcriptional regulator [Streptomyces sp. NBC_01014]